MPLIDRAGDPVDEAPDAWTFVAWRDPFDAASNTPLALTLTPDAAVTPLPDAIGRAGLVVVAFGGFSDGRGFSQARRLRAAGYRGRLRAQGPLIVDQFAYALACGFDEIELPEQSAARQPPGLWRAALRRRLPAYQRGRADGGSILDVRRAAAT